MIAYNSIPGTFGQGCRVNDYFAKKSNKVMNKPSRFRRRDIIRPFHDCVLYVSHVDRWCHHLTSDRGCAKNITKKLCLIRCVVSYLQTCPVLTKDLVRHDDKIC
jgi:hypothetical protein